MLLTLLWVAKFKNFQNWMFHKKIGNFCIKQYVRCPMSKNSSQKACINSVNIRIYPNNMEFQKLFLNVN